MLRKELLCTYPITFLQDKLHGIMSGDMIMIAASTGCHCKDTEIIMADGTFKKVQDVVVGDKLCGSLGEPRTVLNLIRGKDKFYRITPTKGTSFDVNSQHILHLYDSRKHTFEDYSVEEYLNLSNSKKHVLKLCRSEGIKNFDRKNKPLSVDPYFLGALIGDGCFIKTVDITTPDPELVLVAQKQAKKYGLHLKCYTKPNAACSTYRFFGPRKPNSNKLILAIKELGIYGAKCGQKFIPEQYKYGSFKTRAQILAGLLDTDGYKECNCCYEIITKGKQLSEDILFIARSLGLAAYRNDKFVKNYGAYNRITISGNCNLLPLKVKRKKSTQRGQIKNVLYTGFSVEPTKKQDYYGFNIDGDNLYLTSDFTIHHNCGKSSLSRILVNHAISEGCPAVLFSLEDEPQTYATDSVYKEYLKQAFEPLDFREWLLDYSDNPKKYEEFAKIAALKAVNEIKGLQSCKVYEMKTPNWSLEEIINLITKNYEEGYRLFILDHMDVLVPSESPSDMVRAINDLWRLVAEKQIALITFSQLASNRNKESLCPGIDDLRGSKSKVHTPTIVLSIARHIYGFYPDVFGKPTYCRILKNRQGGNTCAAVIYFNRGTYAQEYKEVKTNESGTTIDGETVTSLIKKQEVE